jgi:hypothetical protein
VGSNGGDSNFGSLRASGGGGAIHNGNGIYTSNLAIMTNIIMVLNIFLGKNGGSGAGGGTETAYLAGQGTVGSGNGV